MKRDETKLNYSNFKTEERNPNTIHIDKMSTYDMLMALNEENKLVPLAVEKEIPQIEKAVDAVANAFKNGGRLIYIGAGTSGRLGVIDAAECPPTFGVDPDTVIAVIAGGAASMVKASEKIEDIAEEGIKDIEKLNVGSHDVVVGISASGSAKYVIAALNRSRELRAVTVCVCCNPDSLMKQYSDICITPYVGPEAITGSTRLKAGSAQKLVLNMISTGAMIKTGKVYENLMINIKPVNDKLFARAVRIICEIAKVDETLAAELLTKYSGDIRKALDSIANT